MLRESQDRWLLPQHRLLLWLRRRLWCGLWWLLCRRRLCRGRNFIARFLLLGREEGGEVVLLGVDEGPKGKMNVAKGFREVGFALRQAVDVNTMLGVHDRGEDVVTAFQSDVPRDVFNSSAVEISSFDRRFGEPDI